MATETTKRNSQQEFDTSQPTIVVEQQTFEVVETYQTQKLIIHLMTA